MKRKSLTAIEFDVLLPFLGISENRISAARAALVDCEGLQAIADRYGWTRQAVYSATQAVLKAKAKYDSSNQLKEQYIDKESQ